MVYLTPKEYEKYIEDQTVTFASSETAQGKWNQGQRRYLDMSFQLVNRQLRILDAGCGEGVGLQWFRDHGYTNVSGLEMNAGKAKVARQFAPVIEVDFHSLPFEARSFDVVYSSHSLEHAFDPLKVLDEFNRILKPNGRLFLVLPYPDPHDWNTLAHCGKQKLNTDVLDGGEKLCEVLKAAGFNVVKKSFDDFREPEIWLLLARI